LKAPRIGAPVFFITQSYCHTGAAR